MALYKTLVKKVPILPEKKTKQKDYLPKGQLPIIDQGQQLIGGYSDNLDLKLSCNLPVIVFGDHTRAVKYVDFPFGAGADGIKVLEPAEGIYSKFLYYATQYLVLRLGDRGYARHYQYIEKMELDIPPDSEQKRIVARIEELFSELDNGVETLRKTKQQLVVYRQAVLKEAFQKCIDRVPIQSVCKCVTDGDHMPPPKAPSGVPFVMISNVENSKILWDNTAYVSREYFNAIDSKRKPKKGDVLYTVTGSYGIPILVDFKKEFCFQRHIALLRPNDNTLSEFLYYALMEPSVYAQATKGATGTAQKTVGLGVLRRMVIPYTSSVELQERIVSEIEGRLSMCEHISETVDVALHEAEAMRQSILKQAFEGRL